MKVLSVASECAPLVKTGGLADVVGALPGALAAEGVDMRVMLPAYPGLAERLTRPRRLTVPLEGQGAATLIAGRLGEMRLYLVEAPELYARGGGPYLDQDGADWPDNHLRFGWLARVAAAAAKRGAGRWRPDIVHAHDWQAGLTPAYLKAVEGGGPPVLTTIHNIAFQGVFPAQVLGALGLPQGLMTIDGLEYWGGVSFLKGGLALSERISTVSPGYARELMRPDFGLGMEGLLRHRARDFTGILNGIDEGVWNPADDPALAAPYAAGKPAGKAKNRAALAERFRLTPHDDAPLFIVVSRLTRQKGIDLILAVLPALLERGACLAVLGSGERGFEAGFAAAAAAHPGRVGLVTGYDEPLSHLMQGGGDAILVPSRFEPCGLTQLYGLRYGAVPVVARTGGLADTVIDANPAALAVGAATGFQHDPGEAAALADAIGRACGAFADRAQWAAIRDAGMRQPVGWDRSAAAYAALYRDMRARAS